MIAVVTVLLAFPLGYLLRSHLAANVAYAIAYLWAFTFQTLYLHAVDARRRRLRLLEGPSSRSRTGSWPPASSASGSDSSRWAIGWDRAARRGRPSA